MDLGAVKKLRVLVIGDAIMDEYIYVRVVGKAMKENALSSVRRGEEAFRGGTWAAAEHIRNFVGHVDVWTGENVMWNTRLVDDVYLRKLFVMHKKGRTADKITNPPDPIDYDLTVVCDFGHGLMDRKMIEYVTERAKFLAVNTQANAQNFGFNVINKYPRADYVVLDEAEARLALRDNENKLEDVIKGFNTPNIAITRGILGAIGRSKQAIVEAPAVADEVVDLMGAGDAFFAVSAPFAAIGTKMLQLLRIGNAAAAAKVAIVGHRKSVDREQVERYLG